MNQNFLKSKKLKYGSLSIVFIFSFVALIIALNLILTAVASKVNLTVDLTKEELYSISDETKQVLTTLGEDFDITIYFLQDKDLYAKDKYQIMVSELGEEYAKLYPDNVKVEYKNIDQDPGFVDEYKNETQTALNKFNIIVKGKYHTRVLAMDAFFMMGEDEKTLVGFNGEQRFTAAILQCSIKEPQVITFTTGHDETASKLLMDILYEAGFEIQSKDLSVDEIDPRTRILIISKPEYDFLGYEGSGVSETSTDGTSSAPNANKVNEIDKISDYINDYGNYNSLIVFVDSSTPELPNLQEYLMNYWGLGYQSGHQLMDTNHSVGNDGYSIVGKYTTKNKVDTSGVETSETDTATAAYNIHKVASSMGSGAKTIFRNAVELYSNDQDAKYDVTIESVLTTYASAECFYMENGQKVTKESGTEYPLMLLSTVFNYGENNVREYSYVMLVSSTDFTSSDYLSNKYGNSKIMLGAARVMGTERVNPDIEYKAFIDEAMDIELGTATALTWMVSAIFPSIIIIIGLVVFFKRRHL